MRCRDSRTVKKSRESKVGIKQFIIQPHPTHLEKICSAVLRTGALIKYAKEDIYW